MSDPRLIDWQERATIALAMKNVPASKWSEEETSRVMGIVSAVAEERAITPALRRLIIAARIVAYESPIDPEALRELDRASEAFAAVVPWDDEPSGEEPEQ